MELVAVLSGQPAGAIFKALDDEASRPTPEITPNHFLS